MQNARLHALLDRIAWTLDRVLYWITAGSAAAFFLIILIAVLSRYARIPWLSAIEWSRLLFVWSCSSAAALAYNRQAHIALTFLTDRMAPRLQLLLLKLGHLLALFFFILLTASTIEVIRAVWPTHLPTSGLSQGWFYVPLAGGSPLMAFYAFRFLIVEPLSPESE